MTPLNITIFLILIAGLVIGIVLFLKQEINLGQIGSVCSSLNGIVTCNYKLALAGATTTPCFIKSPAATSSIVHASFDTRTSASSSVVMTMGKSNNTGSITTLLGSLTLAANAVGTLIATSTLDTSDNLVIAPSNYVNMKFSTNFINALNGSCEVIFRVL